MYRITLATIKNFKRIKDVTIAPGADSTVVLIGGKNRQGKSSTLDALTTALGGKRSQPTDPVRHGADEASIVLALNDANLDDGAITVTRVIQPDGEETVTALTAEVDSITKMLAVIDDRKAEILAAAKLPVDGLSVSDDGVTLNDVPFAQASGAEKLRVALALAIAASPGLADVWIRDGALLDEESLALVQEHAKATGHRVWIERVGTSDDGVIVIADGKVA